MCVLHVEWDRLRLVVHLNWLRWGLHQKLVVGPLLVVPSAPKSLVADQALRSDQEDGDLAVVSQSLRREQLLQGDLGIAHRDDIQILIGTDRWQQDEKGNGQRELSNKQNGG